MKKYIWVFEWITVALLTSLAIITVVNPKVLLFAFGIIFIIFGLLRIVPLIKTTDSKLIKWLILVETIIDVVVGGFLLICVFKNKVLDDNNIFGYAIGLVIYFRGFMHFLSTSVKNEPSTFVGFLVNIGFLTVSTVIISNGGINQVTFSWIFFTLVLICAIILALKGYKDYGNYRGNLYGQSKFKKIKVEENVSNEEKKPNDSIDNSYPQEVNIDKKDNQDSINI